MAIHVNHTPRRGPEFQTIPDEFIAKVNERADILAIVQRSVNLKKAGSNNWLGLCPFHAEKSPSFTVTPHKGMYHCFGCGANGGPITFLMEHDGTPFRDAVKELAQAIGLPLPASLTESTQSAGPSVETAPLYAAMQLASTFFRHVLRHDQASIDYLKRRGISQATAAKFQVGAAPNEWRSLQEAFPDYATNPFIVQSGLVREKESTSEGGRANRYDTFRSRIMFPVRDTRGRIVAFGGRIVGEGDPKYLNSPETPIFSKSGCLYGLFEAREAIRTKKLAIVVEGYIDVAMLSQAGIENAVACLGTSMTRGHVECLLTQTDTVAFAFDGDSAGRRAAWKALETCTPLLEDQHDFRFLLLPTGKDPDDLAREEGAVAFEERVRKSPSFSEFLIGELRLKHNSLASTEDQARFASEASLVAGRLSYKTKLRKLLLQRISEEARVPGSVIKSLEAASANRSGRKSIWSTLSAAAITAPASALVQRDLLQQLLDTEDEQERDFSKVLDDLRIDDQPDRPTDAAWLLARDTMNAAVDLICEHRQQQVRSETRARYQNGEISEEQYLRMSVVGR